MLTTGPQAPTFVCDCQRPGASVLIARENTRVGPVVRVVSPAGRLDTLKAFRN